MIRILNLLVPASVLAMFFSEAGLIASSYVLAAYLAERAGTEHFLIDQGGWQRIALVTGLILVAMYFRQLYGELRIRSRILLLQELTLVVGTVFVAEALIAYSNLGLALPRGVLLPGSAIALAGVYAWRILIGPSIAARLGVQRVLFIGAPQCVVKLCRHFDEHPEAGFTPVGYVSRSASLVDAGLPCVGSPDDLNGVVERYRPDCIVVGERSEIASHQVDQLIDLRYAGVPIEDVDGFYQKTIGRVCGAEVTPVELIFSEASLPNALSLRFQSMYSTALALVLLPLLIPVMAIAAIAIKAGSRGSVLIRDRRLGMGSVPFTMYRFRSRHHETTSEQTAVGRFIAGFGLDKLPQIWNILLGEMSFVGPAPDRPEFAERLNQAIPFHSQRLLVRPGVIGWAQIYEMVDGARHDAVKRLEYDLYYIKNLSPLLDSLVILRWFREALLFREFDRV